VFCGKATNMEHWQKILIGFAYSIGFAALAYPLLRWLFTDKKGKQGREYDNRSRITPAASWPIKVRSPFRGAQNIFNVKSDLNQEKSKLSDEEETETSERSNLLRAQVDSFIYDEYESFSHNCLVMLANDDEKCIGMCIFLLDRKVEYYVEELPKDIPTETTLITNVSDETLSRSLTSALLGISQWSDQWCAAESVNVLLKDKDVVLKLNAHPEDEEISKLVSDLALLNGYKIYCQWTENFRCDTDANEELWEGLIVCCDHLLKGTSIPWFELGPSEAWERKKINLHTHSILNNIKR